jgi:hypothetical protein
MAGMERCCQKLEIITKDDAADIGQMAGNFDGLEENT